MTKEGVGKKIVEALKMQADNIEDVSIENEKVIEETIENTSFEDISVEDSTIETPSFDDETSIEETPIEQDFPTIEQFDVPNNFIQPNIIETPAEMDFEMPSNVAVLKNLISKLPGGVTKQTGALIIKQTMEALGISMRSVLQEAQQVQEGLNNSSRECQATILEYKKQIGILEKQAQKYQRQYAALNDVISLFIQTNM